MKKTQNQDSFPMTTHNSNHSINTQTSSKSPSLGQDTKKNNRVNLIRPEPERPFWKNNEFKMKNRDSLSKKANEKDEEKEVEIASAPCCVEESGRERLKRHRVEVAGRVWIPDVWGQEDLLKDWIDCSVFDASLGNKNITSARAALVKEGRRTTNSGILSIENRC